MDTTIEKMKTVGISKRGGARPGAGRKPRLQHEAREIFNAAIDARWPLIMRKLDELIEKGDKDVLRMVVEQRIGKPGLSLAVKDDHSTRVNYNLFFNPKVREATRVFEEVYKEQLIASYAPSKEED